MATLEHIQPLSTAELSAQVTSGGLVPDYTGPEIWDCTDERPLVPFHALRRNLEFGDGAASFAIAGGREGFALVDLALRAALEGKKSLQRYEHYLSDGGNVSAFVAHSVRLAQKAQYGKGRESFSAERAFEAQYGFFRRLKDTTEAEDFGHRRKTLAELMKTYDAAVLNTHSDKSHEQENRKIRFNPEKPAVGCAHNKLCGRAVEHAADGTLFEAAKQVGEQIGYEDLPLDLAVRGLSILATEFNRNEPYSVHRVHIVKAHDGRYKPADIILDGSHLPLEETSLIIDGGRTARNIAAQTRNQMQTFMSNPVMVAERLAKLSEFGENHELTIATVILHGLSVRDLLCGENAKNDPAILGIKTIPA